MILFNLTGFVERQVEEVATAQRNLIEGTSSTGFTTTNQTFNGQDVACIHIAFLLCCKEFLDFSILVLDCLIRVIIEKLIETIDKMHETYYFFITYGDISGCFVCNVHFMTLLNQTA